MDRGGRQLVIACTIVSLLLCTACNSTTETSERAQPATRPVSTAADCRREYDQRIDRFADGTPAPEITGAIQALKAAGVDAFPALVNHFDDRRIADDSLAGAVAGPTTIGDVCFEVLQRQVEGDWSKAWRDLQALTPENAAAWLDARRGHTLAQLQRDAARDALHNVEAALAVRPSSEGLRRFAEELRERAAARP